MNVFHNVFGLSGKEFKAGKGQLAYNLLVSWTLVLSVCCEWVCSGVACSEGNDPSCCMTHELLPIH